MINNTQFLDCNELYLDLIPRDAPRETEGPWHNIWSFGFGLATTYDPYRKLWVDWDVDQTDILWRYLKSRGMIIGFNTRDFDFQILSFLGDTTLLPSLDLMKIITNFGYPRVSMKNLAINNGYCPPTFKLSSVVKYFLKGNKKLAQEHLRYNIRLVRTFLRWVLEEKELYFWNSEHKRKEFISVDILKSKVEEEIRVQNEIRSFVKHLEEVTG